MKKMAIVLLQVVIACLSLSLAQSSRNVTLNRAQLDDQTLDMLEEAYGVSISDGSYWYDSTSGMWGYEGGPVMGQITPDLPAIAPLPADISGGGTWVFVNGRELHMLELGALYQIYGFVFPGRYWLDPYGNGGLEGGPAYFNLVADVQSLASPQGGGGSWLHRGEFGSFASDGGCGGYNDPESGVTVLTSGC